MQPLKYLVCSLMVLIICFCEISNGEDCSWWIRNRGCYKWIGGSNKQLNHLLLNDRDGSTGIYINWTDYHNYLESFICRCANKAFKEGYKTFGIQFWGECWGSKNLISEDSITKYDDCANGFYEKCRNVEPRLLKKNIYGYMRACSGKAYSTYVYDVDVCEVCHSRANCINSAGSFICQCKDGYVGNGLRCISITKSDDIFTKYDQNSDGQMDIEELRQHLQDGKFDPSESMLKDMFNRTDIDGSGFIDRQEFSQMFYQTRSKFQEFDENGDGLIERNEIKLTLKEVLNFVTDDEVNELLQQADVDRDGKINYDEFITDDHLKRIDVL